jgi:hypothetical protein
MRWIMVLTIAMIVSTAPVFAGQEPAPPAEAKAPATESSSTHKSKKSHANDLLIRGTVFDQRGLSVPGVKLRIHRAEEKKNRWETYSNSRGEFAVRVPQGADYEIVAEDKGFAKQSHGIKGKSGISEDSVIFHLEPVKGGKP